jgi:hypothetical protein
MAARLTAKLASIMRGTVVLVAGSVALGCALASCTSAEPERLPGAGQQGSQSSSLQEDDLITLRVRHRFGPWKKSLTLKLNRNRIRSFSVCAIRNWHPESDQFGCEVLGPRLPEGTLRLEQNPIRSAAPRTDSPGWGMLGLSIHDRLEAVLSNTASGNRFGRVYYRVTERSPSGRVIAQSNRVVINWYR